MSEVATTPTDVAQPSLDDKIAAKFGLETAPPPEAEQPSDEAPADDAEVEVDEEEAPEEEDSASAEAFEEIKHNGEVKRVSKEEMRNLAQKGFDYEANMVQNKVERQRLQGIATALQAQQALGAQVLEHVAEAKAIQKQLAQYKDVDWIKYSNEDPVAAFQQKQVYERLVSDFNRAAAAATQADGTRMKAEAHVTQERLAYEQGELVKRVPEWKDESRASKEKQAIAEVFLKNFKPEELQAYEALFTDHRVIALARDAWKYQQAVEAGKAKRGQLQGLPQPAKPGVRQQAPTREQSVREARTDLRKARSEESRKAATDRMIAAKFGIKL